MVFVLKKGVSIYLKGEVVKRELSFIDKISKLLLRSAIRCAEAEVMKTNMKNEGRDD